MSSGDASELNKVAQAPAIATSILLIQMGSPGAENSSGWGGPHRATLVNFEVVSNLDKTCKRKKPIEKNKTRAGEMAQLDKYLVNVNLNSDPKMHVKQHMFVTPVLQMRTG